MIRSSMCILLLFDVSIIISNGQSRGESFPRTFPLPPPPFQQQQQQQQQQYYNPQQQLTNQSPINVNYINHQQQPQQQQQYVRPPQYYQQQQQQQSRPNYQNQQAQRPQYQFQAVNQQNLDTRFSDDPAAYNNGNNDGFTTRRPPNQPPRNPTPQKPPPSFTSTSNRFDDYNNRKLTWDRELALNTERFSLQLFFLLIEAHNTNFMISPRSIHNLLVLIAEGAAGNTYVELDKTLGLISKQRTRDFHQYNNLALNKSAADINLKTFSALIGDQNRPIGREYDDIVEKVYDADYIAVNFQDIDGTLREVNNRVATDTNGQIREVLTRDDLLKAQLILLSGINFQGRWKNVFNTSFTKQEPFKDIDDNNVLGSVNMMFQRGAFPFAAIREFGSYFVELPYGSYTDGDQDDRISMIVVLPKKGFSLIDAADQIYKHGLNKIFFELRRAKEEYDDDEVEVHIPRFEVDTSINLVPTLQDMGIKDLFEQSHANLNGINNNYFVSSVLHKTKIRVDEKGTEASGVTTSIFANKATPPKFHANRPFLYFIVDKSTRLILFAGTYQKPSLI